MAEMIFFMDPECSQSKKQMADLEKAGNTLHCKDLTFYKWSAQDLLPFVRGRDPLRIMNTNASAIRKGKIDPLLLSFEEALAHMVESPSLIKGPLILVDNLHIQGSNDTRLNKYLSQKGDQPSIKPQQRRLRLLRDRNRQRLQQPLQFLPFLGCSYG